nr:unnamed protein product [Digitaria exilis]
MDSLFSLFSKGKARHDIAGAIEDIEKQLQKVAERRARYKLDDVVAKPAATSTIDPRLVAAMNIKVNKLIGIDKSSGELTRMLSPVGKDSTGKTKIVSIVGVGGLGKTTLAQAVYDKLNPNIGCGAFVPVGRDRDVKRVLRDILIDLDKKYMDVKYNILDEWQLIKELKDFLRSNRLYGGEDKCPTNHPADASEKILKKCGGVPLVIITMAKDCLIEKDALIWKWIAEGFVEMKTGTNWFQRGEEYFNQLINSSLIQAAESIKGNGTDSCRVHDMVLDLIREMSKKVNFVTISNDDGEGTLQRNKQVRRLAHHDRSMKQIQEDDDMGMAKVRFWRTTTAIGRLPVNAVALLTWQPPYEGAGWVAEEGDVARGPSSDDESKRQFMKDLGNLSQVRVLSIYGELRGGMALQSELVQSLGNVHKLQHLRLVDYNFDDEDDPCEWVEWEDTVELPRGLQELDLHAVPFRRLPSCISPAHLQNLYTLWLRVEAIDEAGLRALGGLPELRLLGLLARQPSTSSTATVASINISGEGFF